MYDSSNFKKIGFTEKVGLLEEEVRTSLLQRYATTLMCPRILQLVKVSNPRRAEKRTFQILEKFRIDKEIFKVDMTEVRSALQVVQRSFHRTRLESPRTTLKSFSVEFVKRKINLRGTFRTNRCFQIGYAKTRACAIIKTNRI